MSESSGSSEASGSSAASTPSASLANSPEDKRAGALADTLCESCIDEAGLARHRDGGLRRIQGEDDTTVDECTGLLRADGRFDLLATCFQHALCDDPFHQTENFERGVSTLTTVRMEGYDPKRVFEAMVEMPWSRWWRHGRVVKWRRTEQGADFYLWPLWLKVPIRVRISIDAVEKHEEAAGGLVRQKLVMPARFMGCFEGPARFEIVTLPDGCVLRAAWEGVFPKGWVRILSYERMARNHLAAERGEMPGAEGGGYLGLRQFLDGD